MSAPLAKGIIIAAGIVLAAGLAIYENEQIRFWLDERRRRIAIALHDMGDNISPPPSSRGSTASADIGRQRRMDIVRRNRAALIRRAQEEGIAVDLDELSAIGRDLEMEQRRSTNTSFDDFVSSDGTLRETEIRQAQTSGSDAQTSTVNLSVRQRGAGARGLASGAAFGNPFDDDAQMMFDRELIAPSPGEHPISQVAASSVRTMSPRPASTLPSIIDIPIIESMSDQEAPQSQYKTDDELEAEIEEAIRRSLQDMAPAESTYSPPVIHESTYEQLSPPTTHTLSRDTSEDLAGLDDSLYALPSPRSVPEHPFDALLAASAAAVAVHNDSHTGDAGTPSAAAAAHDGTTTPRGTGTLTPTSEVSAFSSALSSGPPSTHAADEAPQPLDVRSLASDDDVFDAQSEAGMSEAYSLVGASTPGSWTDVDTDAEGEEMNGSRAARI